MTNPAALCHVCNTPLTGEAEECNNCFRPFHLRKSDAGDGLDCGRVWINEQFLSLEFACNSCLGANSVEPPVAKGH